MKQKKSADLTKGFTCRCGEYHEYSLYVYAHTRDELIHTCPKCRRKHSIINLCAREIKK